MCCSDLGLIILSKEGDVMNYIIETKNLSKRFDSQIAVDKVNLHVPKGKIYGLLGRNGAGKTTIMRMLLGLATPTDGEIFLFGETHSKNKKQIYKRIGSLIESPGFYENLTGYENLKLISKLRGHHKDSSVIEALKTVGLENELKKTYSNYSLGMKQRLGIAAAVMHEPELLILDEPINGLDPVGISKIRSYFEKLCSEKGVTIFISSHILSEIEQLADIIGVIHEGKVVEEVFMKELHKRNRCYVEFIVSDINKACLILEEQFKITDYSVLENNVLRIFSMLEIRAEMNKAFVANSIDVFKLNLSEEKLEDYFNKLIGGGDIG